MKTREERDTFGVINVPIERMWGAQTQRSLEHFHISTECMPRALINALAHIKLACAAVNAELGLLSPAKASAIALAASEVLDGKWPEEFPLSVWQTGSGTQTNMNINEVLANRASELLGGPLGIQRLVHPNDDVNLGQSSNDVFPTAMHVAAVLAISENLQPALQHLRVALQTKSDAYSGIVKVGRTHLQDAVPLTLGQEFSGYVAQLMHIEVALRIALVPLMELAIGGTAVGTGLNTPSDFGERVAANLEGRLHTPFRSTRNKFAALAAHDALVAAHGTLKTLAVALMKIANDLRWLASGPRAGLGEISLPENEPGSSIMPGKVNPTQCEAVTMVCCQVFGNDVAITVGGASGNFELNVFKPLIAHNFLQSVRLLADSMTRFEQYCVRGLKPNRERIAELLEHSLMVVTALAPHIGYERAAEIAHQAHQDNSSLKVAALKLGYVDSAEFDNWVRPEMMARPH